MAFVKAIKAQSKLRMAISGPSGSGKTYSALRIAKSLSGNGKIAVIDSEYGSASKYADKFDFDVCDISSNKHPNEYIKAINEAAKYGYSVVIVDSITHAWEATKSEVDRIAASMRSANTYTSWKEGTKIWESLKSCINSTSCHVIVTMRAKTEYVLEDVNGKKVPKKIGMAPEVRDGTEYEFDAVLEMTHDHYGRIGKTRCEALDGWCGEKPGEDIGAILFSWLTSGVEADSCLTERVVQQPPPPAKREANESDRPDFDDRIKAAVVRIGLETVIEVCVSHGYDDPGKVLPKDFRNVLNAIKEIEQANK